MICDDSAFPSVVVVVSWGEKRDFGEKDMMEEVRARVCFPRMMSRIELTPRGSRPTSRTCLVVRNISPSINRSLTCHCGVLVGWNKSGGSDI